MIYDRSQNIMSKSLQIICWQERESRGITISEKADPNKTGIIGEEYT